MKIPSLQDGTLPVFAFPAVLEFYSSDISSHKQILTIYNPYEFTLKYKVYSTAPNKYNVVGPEGSIKAHCCMDVVIRHNNVNRENEGKLDKFRIKLFRSGEKKVIGQRDITARLYPNKASNSEDSDDRFEFPSHSLPQSTTTSMSRTQSKQASDRRSVPEEKAMDKPKGPDMLIILIAVVCLVVMLAPTAGEISSYLPDYIRISQNHKLIAAYVLGLVTVVIVRP